MTLTYASSSPKFALFESPPLCREAITRQNAFYLLLLTLSLVAYSSCSTENANNSISNMYDSPIRSRPIISTSHKYAIWGLRDSYVVKVLLYLRTSPIAEQRRSMMAVYMGRVSVPTSEHTVYIPELSRTSSRKPLNVTNSVSEIMHSSRVCHKWSSTAAIACK